MSGVMLSFIHSDVLPLTDVMCQSEWTAECRYRTDQLTGGRAEAIQISCGYSTPGTAR